MTNLLDLNTTNTIITKNETHEMLLIENDIHTKDRPK